MKFAFATLIFLASSPASGAAASEPSADRAMVRIDVDAAYDDSAESVSEIANLLSALPPLQVKVERGDNLSKIVLANYGFGPDNLPRTYAVVAAEIRRLNGLRTDAELRPGLCTIPLLPRRALPQSRAPHTVLADLPRISTFEVDAAESPAERSAIRPSLFSRFRSFIQSKRRGSKTALLRVSVPLSSLRSLLSRLGSKVTVENTPMLAHLASSGAETDTLRRVLDARETRRIQQLLSEPPKRRVMLAILDSGWPSPEALVESFSEIQRLLRQASTRLKLDQPTVSGKAYVPPANAHCQSIEKALREFRNTDAQRSIIPVYVPMTRDQSAAPLIEEILFIHFVNLTMGSSAGLDPPPRRDRDQARANAKAIVARLPERVSNSLIRTDKAILDALFTLARLNNIAYVVNTSWTVPDQQLEVTFPNLRRGVLVAAAGNDGKNVHKDPVVDFPARSINHLDTLAVINAEKGRDALLCDSSYVEMSSPSVRDQLNAVAFDGRVSEGTCGTSFAAPRVAWLIAVYEAVQRHEVPSEAWCVELHERLRSTRSGSNYAGLWLDVMRFLDGVEN
jgi:hypothetical protein